MFDVFGLRAQALPQSGKSDAYFAREDRECGYIFSCLAWDEPMQQKTFQPHKQCA